MDVRLPNVLNRLSMYGLIDSVLDRDKEPRSRDIKFFFHDLFFIEPVGVTVLGNITKLLLSEGVHVTYTYFQHSLLCLYGDT